MRTNEITLTLLHKSCDILKGMKSFFKSASGLDHQQWCSSEIHAKH